jgi:hypothetical protein
MYLQQAHFFSLRRNIDRLHAHHLTLTDFLRTQPRASMDAYVFLDAQDWMDQSQLISLWEEVNRTAAPGARVVFRTAGQSSPLEAALPTHCYPHGIPIPDITVLCTRLTVRPFTAACISIKKPESFPDLNTSIPPRLVADALWLLTARSRGGNHWVSNAHCQIQTIEFGGHSHPVSLLEHSNWQECAASSPRSAYCVPTVTV